MRKKNRQNRKLPCIFCENYLLLGDFMLTLGRCQELGRIVDANQISCENFKRLREKKEVVKKW